MSYTIEETRQAECTLEPMICTHCGSDNVSFNQSISDAYCSECGQWQDDDEEPSQ